MKRKRASEVEKLIRELLSNRRVVLLKGQIVKECSFCRKGAIVENL